MYTTIVLSRTRKGDNKLLKQVKELIKLIVLNQRWDCLTSLLIEFCQESSTEVLTLPPKFRYLVGRFRINRFE